LTDLRWVLLGALGVLAVVGLIVGLTLNHHVGGFIETVAREEEAAREAEDKQEQKQ